MSHATAQVVRFNNSADSRSGGSDESIRDLAWELAEARATIEAQKKEIAELRRRDTLAERRLIDTEKCIITNLPNRKAFNEEADRRKKLADKGRINLYYIMIDLSKFKDVNDTYGHEGGDIVLRQVAIGLKKSVRKEDMVVHFSGDEFGVLISGTAEEAAHVYQRIKHMFDKIIVPLEKGNVRVKGNLGMAQYMPHKETIQNLVTRADLVMYEEKKAEAQASGEEVRNVPRALNP